MPSPTGDIEFVQRDVSAGYRARLMERDVSIYPLAENEMNQLASTTTKATVYWSVATLFIGIGASALLSGLSVTGTWTAEQVAAFEIGPVLCLFFAACCIVAAALETHQRRSMLDRVKRESRIPGSLSAIASEPEPEGAQGSSPT